MEIIDITLPVAPRMLAYAGDPAVELVPLAFAEPDQKGSYNLSLLELSTHAGTHVDPPLHFDHQGADAASLRLEWLCGRARVIEWRGPERGIDQDVLRDFDLDGVERLLLKTENSARLREPFHSDYVHLTGGGARYLASQSLLQLVGIDYLSIDAFPADPSKFDYPAHRALLERVPPVAILEGIDLGPVEPGDYELWCLPLKLAGGDGAPARAVLVRR